MRRFAFVAIVAVVIAGPVRAASIDVSACPALVPANTVGVLQADLDCTAPTSNKYVVLERGATLDLNGHSLTFHSAASALSLVYCTSRCTVQGPGTLAAADAGYASISIATNGRATIRNVDISGMYSGVQGLNAKVKIEDSTIDAVQWGIATVSKADVSNVTIATSIPGGYCIGATDESGSVVKGHDVMLTSCTDGVWASGRVKLSRLTAVGHASIAVYSGRSLVLKDSTVTGAGYVDVLSPRRPTLVRTTCDRSGVDTGDTVTTNWGVCAND